MGSSCITIETETVNLLTREVNEADDGGEEVSDEHGDGVMWGQAGLFVSSLCWPVCVCLFLTASWLDWSGVAAAARALPLQSSPAQPVCDLIWWWCTLWVSLSAAGLVTGPTYHFTHRLDISYSTYSTYYLSTTIQHCSTFSIVLITWYFYLLDIAQYLFS